MEYLQLYAIFALTTSIVSIYELLLPVINTYEKTSSTKVDSKFVIILTTFFINVLIAPLVFLSCIIPSMGIRFRIAMQEGLFPTDTKI